LSLKTGPLLLLAGALVLWGKLELDSPAFAEPADQAGAEKVTVHTDLAGAQEMARTALHSGRPDVTILIARQILSVIPDDAASHMLLAAALTRVGDPKAAVPVAKAGFRLAQVPEARFEGAYLTAEALAAAGKNWEAKLWLRRADLYAPSPEAEAVLAQAYGVVAQRSRLTFGVTLFGGPSENVNGGSLHESFVFMGIPLPIPQALPGFVAGGSLSLRYALPKDASLSVSWAHRSVFLGSRAAAIDPSARGEDFRQDELGFGLEKLWASEDQRTMFRLGGSIGRRWAAGETSSDVARIDAGVYRAVSDALGVSVQVGLEAADVPGSSRTDTMVWSAGLGIRHVGANLGEVSVSLGAKTVDADAPGIAWRGPMLSMGWVPPIESDVIGLALSAAVEARDYWKTSGYDMDLKLGLSATAELKSLEVMGFNPTVTVTAGRTKSDLAPRDTRDLGISFGIESSF
jgi:hypothetical protein